MQKRFFSLIFLVSALMMLPACDWKSWFTHSCTTCDSHLEHDHGHDNGACCISLNGKPAVTQRDFENKFNQLCMSRPDIQQALSSLPVEQQQAFYAQFSEAILAELLVSRYVELSGLKNSPEYKAASKEAHAAVEVQLMNTMFQSDLYKKIEKEITDQVAEKYYEENRDRIAIFKRAPFIDKAGGVVIQMVDGLKEQAANALAASAKNQDFAKVAKNGQYKVKNLGLINQRSMEVDEQVRSKVMGYTSVPQVDVVKLSNGKFAVIKATAIEKESFKPYSDPEVKEAVKSFLIRNELGKSVNKTMDELKQKYGAIIHHENIMKLVKSGVQAAPAQVEPVQEPAAAPRQFKA